MNNSNHTPSPSMPSLLKEHFVQKVDDIVQIKSDKLSDKVNGFAVWHDDQWKRKTVSWVTNQMTHMMHQSKPELGRIQPIVKEAYATLLAETKETYEMDWDRSVNSIPLADGDKSVCLKEFNVIPTPKDDQMLMRLPVTEQELMDADYENSKFKGFVHQWLADDHRRKFCQQAFGQALAGNPDHAIVDMWGVGRNGKGALIQFVKAALGDYFITVDTSYFVAGGQSRHEAGLVKLKHGRIAIIGEFEAGQKVDTGLLKSVAAGDPLSVAYKGKDPFEITAQCLMAIHGNAILNMKDKSKGIHDRWNTLKFVHEVPADQKISPYIMQDIAAKERGVVLLWMLKGLADYLDNDPDNGGSFGDTGIVAEDTAEYFEQENTIQEHLERNCVKDPGGKVRVKDLYDLAVQDGWQGGIRAFGRGLREMGMDLSNRNHEKVNMFSGWELKKSAKLALGTPGTTTKDGELVPDPGDPTTYKRQAMTATVANQWKDA